MTHPSKLHFNDPPHRLEATQIWRSRCRMRWWDTSPSDSCALLRHVEVTRLARFTSGVTRTFGPWMSEQRTGRANLVAAFPEKTPAEIEQILANVWDDLGRRRRRVRPHGSHLGFRSCAARRRPHRTCRPTPSPASLNCVKTAKRALIFASHLGNWELPAIAAAAHGLDSRGAVPPAECRAPSIAPFRTSAASTWAR